MTISCSACGAQIGVDREAHLEHHDDGSHTVHFASPASWVLAEPDDLVEQGRRLATEREDLIARGVDPSTLVVPLHPEPDVEGSDCG